MEKYQFIHLDLNGKSIFDNYKTCLSEYFTYDTLLANLIMWKGIFSSSYAIINKCLCIKIRKRSGKELLLYPIGEDIDRKLFLELIEINGGNFSNITEGQIDYLRKLGFTLKIKPMENMSDYLYRVENLISLKGDTLRKKQNHINYFLNNYNFIVEKISEENLMEIRNFYQKWYQAKIPNNPTLIYEFDGMQTILRHFKELGLDGIAIRINGEIVAFSFGERINNKVAFIHAEKADPAIRGLYPFINREMLIAYYQEVLWVNRADDAGLEGLRRAKRSYDPSFLVQKYYVHIS